MTKRYAQQLLLNLQLIEVLFAEMQLKNVAKAIIWLSKVLITKCDVVGRAWTISWIEKVFASPIATS